MNKIKYYLEKYKIITILIIVTIFLLLAFVYTILRPNNEKEVVENLEIKEPVEEKIKEVEEQIKVDIKGFIKKPGVYKMDIDDRVIDVINKAGGLKEDANTEYINLSKKLVDEMIIIIYSNNDVEKFKEEEKEIIYIEYECLCPDNINDGCINGEDTVNTSGVKEVLEEKEESDIVEDNLVSINTGSLEELMTLSGIGESKAQAIIDYRKEFGKFEKLEDIMNVSGIGEKAYSKIKDSIKL